MRSHVGAVVGPGVDVGVFWSCANYDPVLCPSSDRYPRRVIGYRHSTTFPVGRQVRDVGALYQRSRNPVAIAIQTQLEPGVSSALSARGYLKLRNRGVGCRSEGNRYPGLEGKVRSALGNRVAPDAEVRGIRIQAEVAGDDLESGVFFGRRRDIRWWLHGPHESAVRAEDKLVLDRRREGQAGKQEETRD